MIRFLQNRLIEEENKNLDRIDKLIIKTKKTKEEEKGSVKLNAAVKVPLTFKYIAK